MLALEPNMPQMAMSKTAAGADVVDVVSRAVLAFDHVQFSYVAGTPVLQDATFALDAGKTYALVGRRRQNDDGVAHGAALRSDRRTRAP